MYYATAGECVEAVASGQADYAFLNNYAAQYLPQDSPSTAICSIVPWSEQSLADLLWRSQARPSRTSADFEQSAAESARRNHAEHHL